MGRLGASLRGEQVPFAIHAGRRDVVASKPGGVNELLDGVFHWEEY